MVAKTSTERSTARRLRCKRQGYKEMRNLYVLPCYEKVIREYARLLEAKDKPVNN